MPDEVNESDVDYEGTKINARFRYLAKKKAHFWNRWRKEYLVGLREFHKSKIVGSGKLIQVGDVVLVSEDNVKRGKWRMAEVEKLVVGHDGEVRGAKIRVTKKGKRSIMSRPLQKLYPLEVRIEREEKKVEENKEERNEKVVRPRRAAALDAEWKTKEMLDT